MQLTFFSWGSDGCEWNAVQCTVFIFLCISRILFSLTQLTFFTYSSNLSSALYNNKQREGKRAHSAFHPYCRRPEIITELQIDGCIESKCDSDKLPFSTHTRTHTYIPTPGDRVMQPNQRISQFQHVRLSKHRPLRASGSKLHILKP